MAFRAACVANISAPLSASETPTNQDDGYKDPKTTPQRHLRSSATLDWHDALGKQGHHHQSVSTRPKACSARRSSAGQPTPTPMCELKTIGLFPAVRKRVREHFAPRSSVEHEENLFLND